MNFWSKVKLSDFLLLYFTDLLGKYLSGQIYTFSSISVGCAVILFTQICFFVFMHISSPFLVKLIKAKGKAKPQETFLEKGTRSNAHQSSIPEEGSPDSKIKNFLKIVKDLFVDLVTVYLIYILWKWAIPNTNIISTIGSIIIYVVVLHRYGYFQAFLARLND